MMIDPEGFGKFVSFRLVPLSMNGDTSIHVYIQNREGSTRHLVGAHFAVILSQRSTEPEGCRGRTEQRLPLPTRFGWLFQGNLSRKEN